MLPSGPSQLKSRSSCGGNICLPRGGSQLSGNCSHPENVLLLSLSVYMPLVVLLFTCSHTRSNLLRWRTIVWLTDDCSFPTTSVALIIGQKFWNRPTLRVLSATAMLKVKTYVPLTGAVYMPLGSKWFSLL